MGGLFARSTLLIPNNVRELCDRCFRWCWRLRRVTFGSSSSLEWIGVSCFRGSGVEDVSIPDGVHELCDCCFSWCEVLRRVNFGSSSSLGRIGFGAFPRSVSCSCDPVSLNGIDRPLLVTITIRQPICRIRSYSVRARNH